MGGWQMRKPVWYLDQTGFLDRGGETGRPKFPSKA